MRNYVNVFVISSLVSIFVWSHALSKEIPVESLLPKKLPEGWRQIGNPFQKSVFAHYQNKSNSKDQIELDLYDMGNALQAFGIFSRFRSEGHSAGVGLESHFEDISLLFYKGRYFVMLYATEVDPPLLKRMAMTISSNIIDSSPAPKEIGYFPEEGLKPGSIEYYPEGLLGYQFLKRGFQGVYLEKAEHEEEVQAKAEGGDKNRKKTAPKECNLFLAIFENSQDADDALKTYRGRLSKRGKIGSTVLAGFGPSGLKGEDPNRGKVIIVVKDFYLAGIAGFDSLGHAEKLLEAFIKNIR
jgi:hypothetical protein